MWVNTGSWMRSVDDDVHNGVEVDDGVLVGVEDNDQ